jgi:hypothetical protein
MSGQVEGPGVRARGKIPEKIKPVRNQPQAEDAIPAEDQGIGEGQTSVRAPLAAGLRIPSKTCQRR